MSLCVACNFSVLCSYCAARLHCGFRDIYAPLLLFLLLLLLFCGCRFHLTGADKEPKQTCNRMREQRNIKATNEWTPFSKHSCIFIYICTYMCMCVFMCVCFYVAYKNWLEMESAWQSLDMWALGDVGRGDTNNNYNNNQQNVCECIHFPTVRRACTCIFYCWSTS